MGSFLHLIDPSKQKTERQSSINCVVPVIITPTCSVVMDEKISKLRVAKDEAALQLAVAKQTLDTAETELSKAKDKYRALSAQLHESGDDLQVNDTELPELIEMQMRAKNVYETVAARYETNKRYLDMMIQKRDKSN